MTNKITKKDYKVLIKIVKKYIEEAGKYEKISFFIEEISLYGSVLTDKKEPNDIDIFVFVSEVEDLIDKTKNEEKLAQYLHEYLHGPKQPKYKKLPIDIAIKTYENPDKHVKIS